MEWNPWLDEQPQFSAVMAIPRDQVEDCFEHKQDISKAL
jgi:hypothetical protein